VSRIRVDYAFGLELAEDQERATDEPWRFRINTEFTYASPTWIEEKLDPEGPPGALGPALSVRQPDAHAGAPLARRATAS